MFGWFRYCIFVFQNEFSKWTKMQYLFSLSLVFASFVLSAQVNWISFSDLEKAQQSDPRPVIVDMYTTWCGPCKMMDANTFNHPKVAAYINRHFHAVKFNAEGNEEILFGGQRIVNEQYDPAKRGRNATHPFAGSFAVNGRLAYPTTAYLSPDLKMLTQPIQGYLTPDKIEPILKFFGSKAFERQTWDQFNESFAPEWIN